MVSCYECKEIIRKEDLSKTNRKSKIRKNNFGIFHINCYQHFCYTNRVHDQKVQILLPNYSGNQKGECVFCLNESQKISRNIRRSCFAFKAVHIAKGACVCQLHHNLLVTKSFDPIDLNKISDQFWVSAKENTKIINYLINSVNTATDKSKFLSFHNMNDNQLISLTGMNSTQLGHLQSLCENKKRLVTIPLYFFKLRTGMSDRMIGALLGKSQQNVNYHINSTRELLMQYFVPKHLGLHLVNNQQMTLHTTRVAQGLVVPNRSILVLDGTYIYCQKSGNFDFQRLSYSLHKHRNLFKMFMCVATDGYIISCTGPFEANISDAKLMEDLISDDEFKETFPPISTTLIVDRGFRDIIEKAQALGYETQMPAFLEKKEKQLSTEKANATRCTTKMRFIVEVVNGQIKQTFSMFDKTANNRSLPNAPDHFRIACSTINFIRNGNFHSDKNNPDEISERICQLMTKPNLLSKVVKEKNLTRRKSVFTESIENTNPLNYGFPILSQSQLELFCCGTYQPKMALSYYAEHLKQNGKYQFFIEKDNNSIDYNSFGIDGHQSDLKLFKARMDSRHSKSTHYHIFLLLNSAAEGIDRIHEHYCTCKVGMRTVGCCAHLACLIWYFTIGYYQQSITLPAQSLSDFFSQVMTIPEIAADFDTFEDMFSQELLVFADYDDNEDDTEEFQMSCEDEIEVAHEAESDSTTDSDATIEDIEIDEKENEMNVTNV
jgi:hypothetical protein